MKHSVYIRSGLIGLFLVLFSLQDGISQRWGYIDDFENGSLEFQWRTSQGDRPPILLWGTSTPGTYTLDEVDGVLKVAYSKTEGIGAFDHFWFKPFRTINVRANPRIQIQLRSDLPGKLTVSPTYTLEPPTFEYIEKEIQGDNIWHTYTFELTPAYIKKYGSVEKVDFYLDRDVSVNKKGKIEIDNFKMAWYLIHATGLEARVQNGNDIELTWRSSDEERTGKYLLYRGLSRDFELNEKSLLSETTATFYNNKGLEPYKHYFYKVVPVHTEGEVYFPSAEVHAETYNPDKSPVVNISGTNANTVGRYEKFEVLLDLENVGIENPFDPEDIDVYAEFTSPTGKTFRINGFYDNAYDADQWKLRFAGSEIGEYSYKVFVKDAGGTGESSEKKFNVIASDHHGWIKPSEVNPHYFMYDDGTSYYGVGVYSPWRNTLDRFDTLEAHKANLFAIWDITYGGFVNGTGLIEEELGRYNQTKLGRIDSMLTLLEERDIQMMYALWPHDLFSETVWAAQWKMNPYSKLIDVDDVYSDSVIWEYQKRKYRYMIARFAHSRSMGIWELINEMNGTDGWAHGRHQECYDWVEKCDKYFEENDPYNHPTTASFSGGYTEYREELYHRNDIPNIHVYPTQGWPMKYPLDTMRSAMYNYAWASERFWNKFEKPAIFGESGASHAYFSTRDPNYHVSYHNQIWASLVNGLAATPVWWDYTFLTEADWDQLSYLSDFVAGLDLANKPYKPLEVAVEGVDLYVMGTSDDAFGWGRSYEDQDISTSEFVIRGLEDGNYRVVWYDPWKGKFVETVNVKSKRGKMIIVVPEIEEALDIAFRVNKI